MVPESMMVAALWVSIADMSDAMGELSETSSIIAQERSPRNPSGYAIGLIEVEDVEGMMIVTISDLGLSLGFATFSFSFALPLCGTPVPSQHGTQQTNGNDAEDFRRQNQTSTSAYDKLNPNSALAHLPEDKLQYKAPI
ncbi:hypothetical protein CVT25_004983 [Psilocybe cyanescens]|uniref:Uncharacterized protein n=1 Tax=Psilocybe cyanescens TaxID=93625 RepID=A0A409W229_PSICY|nr:hypothetical protein CVT25_004983 [Psilocybe cyanescens]